MKTQNEQNSYWNKMTIQEAHQHFYFTWQKEIFEIKRLIDAIKKFRVFMCIVAVLLALLIYLMLYVFFLSKNNIMQTDQLAIWGIVACSLYSIFIFKGYKYWYNTAESQYLYVQLCFSLSPHFLKDFSLLNEAHALKPSNTSFQEIYMLEKLLIKYEQNSLRSIPEQY
jgi:hypothetical protein